MNLHDPVLHAFPISEITPCGWLGKQLQTQIEGLSGNLDTFWPDIKDSAWIGGKAEGWERMPYWLDGAIPLAWLLRDTAFMSRIDGYLDHILENQHADGWLGPRIEECSQAADVWSQALAMKMLIVYHDATNDPRVPTAIERALCFLDRHIDRSPLSRWGKFRWFEFLIAVWWLYDRTEESWLIDLAVKLHAQGFHWQAFFERWPLKDPTEKGRWNFAGHVVNNAMAIKESALWWRLTGDLTERNAALAMISLLDQYHGMPTGVFSGDECLAGTSAVQGTELCAVAEYMYSLEWLLRTWGDRCFADRLELITYNALPATFSPDMWSHQYDQQVNQIECSIRDNRTWNTNGPDANIFGLEPNYGCCTANLSQAWPKFAAHLWMRTVSEGIASVAYAPSRLNTTIRGTSVAVEMETDYPFRSEVRYAITVQHPVDFPLQLRIPDWARNATIRIDGKEETIQNGAAYHTIQRSWSGTTRVDLTMPMEPQTITRPNAAISIQRGPLLYALKIREQWRQIHKDVPLRDLPHADWEVHPDASWNYALHINTDSLSEDISFQEQPMTHPVFSPENAPVTGKVKGRLLPGWTAQHGSASPVPASPVQSTEPIEDLTLIPYGCSNLRIAEFPVLDTQNE